VAKRKYRKASGFSDAERAEAVALLKMRGWPEQKGALTAVANHLNIWPTTLLRWATGKSNPPPDNIVIEKSDQLLEALYRLLGPIVANALETVGDAQFRELMTGLGIVTDKIQNLEGKPTERIEYTTPEQRRDRVAELFDRARSRRDSKAAD
jgi:transcriptional regulator with XRE-family HTH domain